MERNTKNKLAAAVIIVVGVVGFLGTMIGAMYIAKGMNDAIQQSVIQHYRK